MASERTDEEVICEWMEPDYRKTYANAGDPSKGGWWKRGQICWFRVDLTLDRLHEVEARLSDEQWQQYREELCFAWQAMEPHYDLAKMYIHATAATKIAALAAVIRAEAE